MRPLPVISLRHGSRRAQCATMATVRHWSASYVAALVAFGTEVIGASVCGQVIAGADGPPAGGSAVGTARP
jgi:hypothetical protein